METTTEEKIVEPHPLTEAEAARAALVSLESEDPEPTEDPFSVVPKSFKNRSK